MGRCENAVGEMAAEVEDGDDVDAIDRIGPSHFDRAVASGDAAREATDPPLVWRCARLAQRAFLQAPVLLLLARRTNARKEEERGGAGV